MLDTGACFGSLAVTIKSGFLNTSIDYGQLFTFRSVSFIVSLQQVYRQKYDKNA